MAMLARRYGIAADSCYNYADMMRTRDNAAIQTIYVVTPNALHRRDVLASAAAGKHVLCEKPMAISAAESRNMIAAFAIAKVRLMIAYRMQYQPHALEAIRLVRSGRSARSRCWT